MKISFIATVFNEGKTIGLLLESLKKQTKKPDEIIIVEGESTDATALVISNLKYQISNKPIKLITKKGNRSVGRNEAIRNATGDIIVCSDAGCILDADWVKNITKPFQDPSIDVVAGYYTGKYKSIFQKCLIPYVLVMPDKVDPKNFLPASRSMAFKKSIWKKAGEFPEKYSYNEDYVFAHKLKKIGANIVFQKNAIAYWLPRNNLFQAFYMFYRFAFGDAQAGIIRPKVVGIFVRFMIFFSLIINSIILHSFIILDVVIVLLFFYCVWAIKKNYRYVREKRAFVFLPMLQFSSDISILAGTIIGLCN